MKVYLLADSMNSPKKLDWDYAFRVIPENTESS